MITEKGDGKGGAIPVGLAAALVADFRRAGSGPLGEDLLGEGGR